MARELLVTLIIFAACGGNHDPTQPDATRPVDSPPSPDATDDAPTLSAVTPASGIVTTSITLTGSRFGAVRGSSTVTVDGVAATISSWSDTQIVATVPDVLPGPVAVSVTTVDGASGNAPFRVVLPAMVYLNNDANNATNSDTVTVMSFDLATGAMAQVGSPIAMGTGTSAFGGCSQSMVVHEHTRHAFASGTSAVAVYNIDPVTGALTAATGSPFSLGGSRGFGMTLNAAGTRLFVTCHDSNQISVFDVAANGALAPVTGSPFSTAIPPDTIAIAVNDSFVYANSYSSSFQGLRVTAAGALTSLGTTYPVGGTAIWTRPGHDQLYVTINDELAVLDINAGTGAATHITGSPFAITGAGTLQSPTFNSDGSRLYMSRVANGNLFAYTLAAAGTPTALAGSPFNFSASITMSCIAMSRDGAYLVGASESQKLVGVFHLDAAGVPTQVPNSPFAHTTPSASVSGLAITF